MPLATEGALLAYRNYAFEQGSITTGTGTWADSPSPDKMQTQQLAAPYALVTPSAGALSFDYTPSENGAVDVVGILGHTLPTGAVMTVTIDSVVVGSVTWTQGALGMQAPNMVLVLDNSDVIAPATPVEISVTNAGTEQVKIGAVWAGPSFRHNARAAYELSGEDYSVTSRVDTTPYATEKGRVSVVPGEFDYMTEDQAIGVDGMKDIFHYVGKHKPVIYIPMISTPARVATTHCYGTLKDYGTVPRSLGPYWRAGFSVLQIR